MLTFNSKALILSSLIPILMGATIHANPTPNRQYTLATLKEEAQERNKPRMITRVFHVPHTDATTLARNLQHLYPHIKISVDTIPIKYSPMVLPDN